MNEDHATDIADDDELTFEVVKPLGGVISVRFNGEEMRRLREEVRQSDTTVSALIKQATLTHIAQRKLERGDGVTIQSADADGSCTLWVSQGFMHPPPVLGDLWLESEDIAVGWNGFILSGSMPLMVARGAVVDEPSAEPARGLSPPS